jgi:hypothetical protein
MDGYGFVNFVSELDNLTSLLIGFSLSAFLVFLAYIITKIMEPKRRTVLSSNYKLSLICPACDEHNPLNSRYCNMCGIPLIELDQSYKLYAGYHEESDEEENKEEGQNGP